MPFVPLVTECLCIVLRMPCLPPSNWSLHVWCEHLVFPSYQPRVLIPGFLMQ